VTQNREWFSGVFVLNKYFSIKVAMRVAKDFSSQLNQKLKDFCTRHIDLKMSHLKPRKETEGIRVRDDYPRRVLLKLAFSGRVRPKG